MENKSGGLRAEKRWDFSFLYVNKRGGGLGSAEAVNLTLVDVTAEGPVVGGDVMWCLSKQS